MSDYLRGRDSCFMDFYRFERLGDVVTEYLRSIAPFFLFTNPGVHMQLRALSGVFKKTVKTFAENVLSSIACER